MINMKRHMKEIFKLMLCLVAIATVTSCNSSLSEQEKAVKAQVEEFKKGGWKVVGDEDLTTAVSKHIEKRRDNTYKMLEYKGIVCCDNIESGKVAARNEAAGCCDIGADLLKRHFPEFYDATKLDLFIDNYRSIYSKEIAVELIPSFYLYRKEGKDQYRVIGYFLIYHRLASRIISIAIEEAEGVAGIEYKTN